MSFNQAPDHLDDLVVAPFAQVAAPPPAVAEIAPAPIEDSETVKADKLKAEAAKAEAARAVAASVLADRAAASAERIERIQLAKLEQAAEGPIVPAPSRRKARPMVLAAAVIAIACAIGVPLGGRWLGMQSSAEPVRDEQPVQGVPFGEEVAVAASAAPQPVAASVKTRVARAPVAPVRQAKPVALVATSALAPSPVMQVPAPVAAPPPPAPVAPEPSPSIAAASPAGRLFQPSDVDQAPQVASRVEPRLPVDLPAGSNDVVIVRLLVSQTGHPFRISVLRGSRLGSAADDAVVAAVTQWIFSPAMKRGEAVSCWYNIGVPLSRAK